MYINTKGNIIHAISDKKIIIFGCGKDGHQLAHNLNKINISVFGAFDNNSELWGKSFAVHEKELCKIMTCDEFRSAASEDGVIVLVASSKYSYIMVQQLLDMNIHNYYSFEDLDFSGGEEYYDENYFEWQQKIAVFGAEQKKSLFIPYISNDDVVAEFGCGGGFLLNALPFPNENKIGVELNPFARQSCIDKGIRCVKGLEELEDESLDILISTMALEHVLNPYEILKLGHKKLKTRGKAVFHVPYEHGIDCEYHRNDFHNHLYTWTPMTLGNLFKVAGYFVEIVETIDGVWPENFDEIKKTYGKTLFDELERINGRVYDKQSILILACKY